MEVQKIIFDDIELEDSKVGLVRLNTKISDTQFFFNLNNNQNIKYYRIENLKVEGHFFDHFFMVFEGYDPDTKTCYKWISNKSCGFSQKKEIVELFAPEEEDRFLIPEYPDIEYVIQTSDRFIDFSLILLPENLAFPIQELHLDPSQELYHIIQFYE